MDITKLERIGLKEKEAKVYIALLKKGQSLANPIAKETKILRSSIYDYLDVLLDKGFISYTIKSGKKYFQAVDPQKILDKFEEQKRIQKKALQNIIPELTKLQFTAGKKANIEVFEGKEGMKSVLLRALKAKPKEALVYGTSGISYRVLPFFMNHFHKQRVKQKLFMRIIYNDMPESKERIKKGPTLKYSKVRLLPIKNVSITGMMIYNETVLITMWNLETPLAISIENKEIAKSYKDNFEVLWNASKKINLS